MDFIRASRPSRSSRVSQFPLTLTIDFPYTLGGGPNLYEIPVSGWTQTGSYTNVSISAVLAEGGTPISAYLTDRIGPGTTVANVIASTSISPTTSEETETLFTGLSLGPASYYVVFAEPRVRSAAGWFGTDSPTVTRDTGVTGNIDAFANEPSHTPDNAFPPASDFDTSPADGLNLLLTVSGNAVSATPEPSSFILAGLAGRVWLSFWTNLRKSDRTSCRRLSKTLEGDSQNDD